ncbi:MAG: hypothetical protein FWG67_08485 [Defluviitaleaceae bacterium]|nr:hypothetical protein [Defluviitaleaceae bacterium]
MKKKQNYFLLGLSAFLLGGTLIFSTPAEVKANVTCLSGGHCWSSIVNEQQSNQWGVRGRVTGIATGNLRATATIRLGNRTSTTGSNTGNGTVMATSGWLLDLNNTSDIQVSGSVTR